jgi:Delta7-sterol 5-desaturase
MGGLLCEIGNQYGFVAIWITLTVLGFVTMMALSSLVFYPLYCKPTFEAWVYKSNPKFPSPALVKKEIIHTTKGLVIATLIPAFAITHSDYQLGPFKLQGYCGMGEPMNGSLVQELLFETVVIVAFSEFFEYAYHWLGHYFLFMWSIHKHHHAFYNPSPFAVIADDWTDQFCRTLPLVFIPLLCPINMDLLFAIYTILFYGYGVYLHGGYEHPSLSAHQPIFNTSYHHYTHHAISAIGRPIYTGFFIKLWDNLFGTYLDKCNCVECRPKRTKKQFDAVEKPDYSVLLCPSYWTKDEVPAEFLVDGTIKID